MLLLISSVRRVGNKNKNNMSRESGVASSLDKIVADVIGDVEQWVDLCDTVRDMNLTDCVIVIDSSLKRHRHRLNERAYKRVRSQCIDEAIDYLKTLATAETIQIGD